MSFGFGNIHSLLTPGATGRQTQVMFGRKQNPSRHQPLVLYMACIPQADATVVVWCRQDSQCSYSRPEPWLTPGTGLHVLGEVQNPLIRPTEVISLCGGVICVIWFREYSFPTHARSHGKADTGNVWEKTKPFQAEPQR